jgi:hypothetical protein
MFEKLFGGLKDKTDEGPSNRPEDIAAARDLAAEDEDLNTPETEEVISGIEADPENKVDVGEALAQRKENAEMDKERTAASTEDAMVQHSEKNDNHM